MKNKLTILTLIFMVIFTSCNPDDEDTNSGNGGNGGNGGGSNTSNAASYPEIVNLLEGSWYGESVQFVNINGNVTDVETTGTQNSGYITFGANSTGTLDLATWLGIDQELTESNICAKYPVDITIIDGSWGGSGAEVLPSYFLQQNIAGDEDSFTVIKYNSPFYNLNTPTIMYGIGYYYGTYTLTLGGPNRIHTLNDDTLIIVWPVEFNIYGKMTLRRI
jgi:hypothetical protein